MACITTTNEEPPDETQSLFRIKREGTIAHLIFLPADLKSRPQALLGPLAVMPPHLDTGLQIDRRVSRTKACVPTS